MIKYHISVEMLDASYSFVVHRIDGDEVIQYHFMSRNEAVNFIADMRVLDKQGGD